MLGIMGKADGGRAAGDRGRLVEGGIGDGKAIAARLIAIGVIGEGGVDDASRDG
jgi:hypothetical protein